MGTVRILSIHEHSGISIIPRRTYTPPLFQVMRMGPMVLLGLMLILTAGGSSVAQEITEGVLGDLSQPWHLTADEISYDNQAQEYIANGNVTIAKQGRTLKADFVRFNHKKLTAMARGNVMLVAGTGDVLTGERLEIDLNSETGALFGGSVFLKENHFYIKGEEIRKVGPDAYQARRAQITTCDGPRPSWKNGGVKVRRGIMDIPL